jgi:hypothetical protein
MPYRLLALFAALLVTPVLAQTVIPAQRPMVIQHLPPSAVIQDDSKNAQKVMTLEDAQAQIARLNAEKRDLTTKLNDANSRLNETLATLDGWTKKGGSLVHAYCASDTLSQRSDGAGQEDCAHNGYTCNQVEGMCRTSCNDSAQCSLGFTCDIPNGNRCVRTG